ncbi:MAG TPA: ABC transporter permease [Gammaproteobacteria bacterium]|nr:ABC transporter permease [Gammaproteobacteria bacterium]
MKFLSAPFSAVWSHRGILFKTAAVEIRGMYAGSLLGLVWVVLGPVFFLGLYTLIYTVIFKIQPAAMGQREYILYIFSGMVPFLAFGGALSAGSSSLAANKQILLNTVFPAEMIPLRSVLVASVVLPVGLLLVVAADVALGQPSLTLLLVPIVMLLQIMFVTGVVWVLSLLNLLIRDIQQILTYVTMVLLVVTPIAYTPDMAPGHLRFIMYLNPLFYFVTSYQSLIVLGELPSWKVVLIAVTLGLGSSMAGYWAWQRGKQLFYEYA